MDRAFLTRQIDVFLQHEPLFGDATEEYRAMTVRNFVDHLAGNWETIVQGEAQLAAHRAKAARDERETLPREFAITQRFLPTVKLTPEEDEEQQRAWNEEVAAWKIKFGHTTTETIEAKPVKTTAIGYWLSKLGIKR